MTTYTIDLGAAGSPYELHCQMKEVFSLPEDYGMNMDALWDCLSYRFREPCRIEVRHRAGAAERLGRAAGALKAVLRDLEEENEYVTVCWAEEPASGN